MKLLHLRLTRTKAVALVTALGAVVCLGSTVPGGAPPEHGGVTYSLIEGSGSTWAANAVNQWVADVAQDGIQVVYTPDGDAQGRADFAERTSAFAVTSIGYQGYDPV